MTDDQINDESAPPAGYVPETEVAELRKNLAITQRKLKQASSAPNPAALMDDPEFVRGVFDKHGVPYDDEGRFKLPETMKDAAKVEEEFRQRLTRSQEQWRQKEVAPLAERLKSYEDKLEGTRRKTLRQALEQGARRSGVVDTKFKPLPFGTSKDFAPVHAPETLFSYDEEVDDWVLRQGEDIVYDNTGKPVTAGGSYWNYFRETADKDTLSEWFGSQQQRGSGFQHNGRGGSSFTISRQEVRQSPSKYRELKQAAAKAGQSVRIID
jgi:hypothetical protein